MSKFQQLFLKMKAFQLKRAKQNTNFTLNDDTLPIVAAVP